MDEYIHRCVQGHPPTSREYKTTDPQGSPPPIRRTPKFLQIEVTTHRLTLDHRICISIHSRKGPGWAMSERKVLLTLNCPPTVNTRSLLFALQDKRTLRSNWLRKL